jgi:hypothetical protein
MIDPPEDPAERMLEAVVAAVLTLATIDTARQHPPNEIITEYFVMRQALRKHGGVFAEPVIKTPWGDPI